MEINESTGLRAILTSVDYWDILSLSLPYNRHHFSEVWVVTTPADYRTQQIALANRCHLVVTNLFYESGKKDFNKWKALDYGLERMGRHGWICIMDADIFWPKKIANPVESMRVGQLLSPLRRMAPLTPLVPSEQTWEGWKVHRNVNEWAGYTQIFNAADPVLVAKGVPWFDTNWTHCGGADSFFQALWSPRNKIRPNWEVLHMGAAGTNWLGRATPYLDGTSPEDSAEKQKRLLDYMTKRAENRGKEDPYSAEKYTPPSPVNNPPTP